ncbi:MAG: aminotransferase class III-fold pyridoxal phosphate-dependent enzyme [Acidimicrobiaceae bacterium]|nr:aminotransferase class III-fold pyridoxal phosphate-dependent enzyme [Acidimicrobiaceae bacterium]
MTDRSHLAPVWSKLTDLEVVSGSGAIVTTKDGSEYLDFTSGIAVTSTGHSHPKVVQAIKDQAERFIHAQVNVYTHDLLEPLAAKLNEITPRSVDTFFFSNSGAEATEGAVKLARQYTKKPNIIVFQGSFHGRTAQTMAMTTSKTSYRAGHSPLPSGVFVSAFPDFAATGEAENVAVDRALAYLDYLLAAQTAPSETAAMVIEPVQGEGGYLPAPKAFLEGVAKRCRDNGILFVVDEVQSGFGRTGKMFAIEHYGLEPDILLMAKGIASGFPISAIGASSEIMAKWPVGSHGGTYGGNPIGCAAALATIGVLTSDGFLDNVVERGEQLASGLRELMRQDDSIGDVRGLGLMVGSTIVKSGTRTPDGTRVSQMLTHAKENGKVLLMNAGTWGNVLRWMPPLIVSEAQIGQGLAAFGAALKATS